jgi:type II secretory ATPase GspE/PulE/Tfp pilus assembly ATPase PilB-like protein
MDIEPFLLASSIIAVLGIRLVRKNCTFCSETYQPEPGLLRMDPSGHGEHQPNFAGAPAAANA